ncbi:MAG: hypothetical protein Q4B53_04545 [Lachnospiraceae bacterium]|nr:hypothetical protein [Lachnospiraceae bacterium]
MVIEAVSDLAGNAKEMIRFVDEEVVNEYDNFVKIIESYEADSEEASSTFSGFATMSGESVKTMNDMKEGINNISSITVQAGENKNISDGLSGEVSKFEKM